MIDDVNPEGLWKFDEKVTACFDNMLERSIPEYFVMRSACANITKQYAKPFSKIIDVGCSNGLVIKSILDSNPEYSGDIYGYEISEPMIQAARNLFKDNQNVHIINYDLRNGLPDTDDKADVILSILTVQFIPIEYRHKVIKSIYNSLKEGGVFLFVEKVLGNTDELNQLMVSEYYIMKAQNGYSDEQINRKRLSLEGVLVPITSRWNEDILRESGFKQIDCFWRWMNFAGWVAVK